MPQQVLQAASGLRAQGFQQCQTRTAGSDCDSSQACSSACELCPQQLLQLLLKASRRMCIEGATAVMLLCSSFDMLWCLGVTGKQQLSYDVQAPVMSRGLHVRVCGRLPPFSSPAVLLVLRCAFDTLSCCSLACSNDAFDAATGVDEHKHESVVNLTGNRNGVLLTAKLFLAAGLGLLAGNINTAHDPRVLYMLGAAIVCGYVYQGPPFRWVVQAAGSCDAGVGRNAQLVSVRQCLCPPSLTVGLKRQCLLS